MSRVIWILVSFSLAGCLSHEGGTSLPLVGYSRATQTRAAAELRALPKDSALAKMIIDYSKLRRAARVK